jgi:ABC-type multidrug transport system ATPase subunit
VTATITASAPVAPAALDARNISHAFGRHQVLKDISFEVAPGSLVGITGENGTGKSTLLRVLSGELRPGSGEVSYRGALGYCPQDASFNSFLTVGQHLEFFRAAYRLDSLDRAMELVRELGFEKYLDHTVASLSGGTRQKLNLTIALMHNPGVLLLDEPYQGFDWDTYLRFWDLAVEVRAAGAAIVVVSHLAFDHERFDTLYELKAGGLALTDAVQ